MKPMHKLVAILTLSLAFTGPALIPGPVPVSVAAGMGSDSAEATDVMALPGYKSAEALIKTEKYAEAIAELEALKKDDDANVLNLLGYSNRKLGKIDEGITFYLKAIEKDPKHKGAHEYLGEAYLEKKDLKNAEDTFAKLKDICGSAGCEEASELETQIAEFKKKQGS